MIAAEGSNNSDLGAFGYACPHRGDNCLIDVDMIAIPGPGKASVADRLPILGAEGEAFMPYSNIFKPKSEWPTASVLNRKRVRCAVNSSQSHVLLKRLIQAGLVTLLNSSDEVVEKSIFMVWKKVGVSQRLIWGGNRAILLFREEASSVELPTPYLIASMFLDEGEELFFVGCDLLQYYYRFRAPRPGYVAWLSKNCGESS